MSPVQSVMPVREAYRSWAETYDTETVLSALDEKAAQALTPPLTGRRLLDAACGTGRRMRTTEAVSFGVDLVFEMVAAGRQKKRARVACADVRRLPFAAGIFDVVWCRLALGHMEDVDVAYTELTRVLAGSGTLIVSDLHPAAARAGHVRSFRGLDGAVRTVEHYIHDLETHADAGLRTGLRLSDALELAVGPDVRSFYTDASMQRAYDEQLGLPLLLALRFTK